MAPWGLLLACLPKKYRACQCFADFGFDCLEERRHAVLRLCMALLLLGFAAAFVGMVGGLAGKGRTLKALAWARFHSPWGEFDSGVVYYCGGMDGNVTCTKWKDMDCDRVAIKTQCELCQNQVGAMTVPIIICVVTYALFSHNTWLRYSGKDSAQAKIMSCFACFWAGTNFLLVLVAFWKACVALKREQDDRAMHHDDLVSMGPGLLLMGTGASGLKYACGFLHLGLPVEESPHEQINSSDNDTDDEDGDGGDASEDE
mmetsp:Transcript_11330/g.30468  ORF Transcript_11330/g.30468 Transcript_11330/m.30468 type:complete len:258 (-) Transcript_11330:39-812(-)